MLWFFLLSAAEASAAMQPTGTMPELYSTKYYYADAKKIHILQLNSTILKSNIHNFKGGGWVTLDMVFIIPSTEYEFGSYFRK